MIKRVIVSDMNTVETIESPYPKRREAHAIVKSVLSGICGSDVQAMSGRHPFLGPPYLPGHEAVGTIWSTDNHSMISKNTRVVLKPNIPCDVCDNCINKITNACPNLKWIGCDPGGSHPGAMAEFFIAPISNLYAVPDDVTDQQAVLIECFATALHALRLVGDLGGRRVVIQGGGTIGALVLTAALTTTAAEIIVSDYDEHKRMRALRLGASTVFQPDDMDSSHYFAHHDKRADVVFDCVANELSASQWTSVLKRGGTVAVVGVPSTEFRVAMPQLQDWGLKISGSASYAEVDFKEAIAKATLIPAQEIIESVFAINDASEAFDLASKPGSGKVLIAP